MTLEHAASGERIEAHVVSDALPPHGCVVTLGPAGHVHYVLAQLLQAGWDIVECSHAEFRLLQAQGRTGRHLG
jgi:hypothetical protein